MHNPNKITGKVIGIFSGLAVLVTPLLAGNVLINPGFEADGQGQNQNLPGWFAYGPNSYSETGSPAHSGTNYCKVYQDYSTSGVTYTGIYQDYISGPGAAYSANGWAYTPSADRLAGQNIAWLEVTFRDAGVNVLALYRSILVATNTLTTGIFPVNTWINLPVTNQYNPNTYLITNTATQLVAPAGTCFVRYQVVFQGDANKSGGSVYFDDLNLISTGGPAYGNWNITWSDEFNGTNINPAVWTFDIGNNGWGNSELEYYTSRTNNAYVAGGLLHIVAKKESYNGANYTSARLKSQGLFSWKYGRIEWRAKLPGGVGFWPALWLLGTNITVPNIGWPGCGEIDVMENNGSYPGTVQASLHSGSDETGYYNFINGGSATNFHTYTLDWGTNGFLFYVDGQLYETQTGWSSSTGQPYPFPFNQPFFLIMNLAVGGSYLGYPDTNTINAGTIFPGEVQVDYVRIYTPTSPLRISVARTNSQITLAWPGNIVCRLQAQTNFLGTNWLDVVTTTNSLPLTPDYNAAFYRLASP